jgi:SAM-dependent methyltransferase
MEGTRDVVTAFDLLEHIFASDIIALVVRIHRALRPGGLGVFNICTRGDGEKDYEFARQESVTVDNSWLLVAGHVTIHTWEWWREMFAAYGLRARLDLCQLFQVRRAEDPTMKLCESWSARNLLIVEKAP